MLSEARGRPCLSGHARLCVLDRGRARSCPALACKMCALTAGPGTPAWSALSLLPVAHSWEEGEAGLLCLEHVG